MRAPVGQGVCPDLLSSGRLDYFVLPRAHNSGGLFEMGGRTANARHRPMACDRRRIGRDIQIDRNQSVVSRHEQRDDYKLDKSR